MKTKVGKWIYRAFAFLILALLGACSPLDPPSSTRDRLSFQAQSGPKDSGLPPEFSHDFNYFQRGSYLSRGNFSLNFSFEDSFSLKGREVDAFVRGEMASIVNCLVSSFSFSSTQTLLITAALPRSHFDFAQKTQEYYYEFQPARGEYNREFCETTLLEQRLKEVYGDSQLAFSLEEICPGCPLGEGWLSRSESLFGQGGESLQEQINLKSLNLFIEDDQASQETGNVSCESNSQCRAQGLDCCSSGQCIRHGQPKGGIDLEGQEYLQALEDREKNPQSIYEYPQFFHLCTQDFPRDPPGPELGEDAYTDSHERLRELRQLYECTTPREGEMALCTVKYDGVTKLNKIQFETGRDDRNFNSTYMGTHSLPLHSLHRVVYGGKPLFEEGQIKEGKMSIGPNGNGSGNDNLSDPQVINLLKINSAISSEKNDDRLFITYKIDGSCEKIHRGLAKCYKIYIQGQNEGKVTDHFPVNNEFMLPSYADLSRRIHVEVNETRRLQGTHWSLTQSTPPRIEFRQGGGDVFNTQRVRIDFYVNLEKNPNVILNKQVALEKIKKFCECVDTQCRLKPQTNSEGQIINYVCSYPPPNVPEPPLFQTIFLDSKTVPHRYYDEEGVYQKEINSGTPPQEGKAFKYEKGDLLRPNNLKDYVGFNEIYGSFDPLETSARGAREVSLKKGKSYDIYVNKGVFSSCFFCGTDYYSQLIKIFPESFQARGGGYRPDQGTSEPFQSSTYRKDDLLFGRACWLPATMIPWTHRGEFDGQRQRLNRLAAQHFLFANGYQRDWYGFDYGSVIGSWDGVNWFAIGNQKRIKAKGFKLFLAVNAYFGDLTQSSALSMTIQETVQTPSSFSENREQVNEGIECRQFHQCQTDRDCITQLGWEYSCESIASLSSSWPSFDSHGLELPNVERIINLRSEFGESTGGVKRCLYRGRGALCEPNYDLGDENRSYSGSSKRALHHCSYNHYCQSFIDGSAAHLFNTKISRYGKSIKQKNQLAQEGDELYDTFGLHVPIVGRPFEWQGTDPVPDFIRSLFFKNKVKALCLPGRNPSTNTFLENHGAKPEPSFLGDKVNGIGMTTRGYGSDEYLSSCSILDKDGHYLYKNRPANTSLNQSEIQSLAAQQAVGTNALSLFEAPAMTGSEIIKNFESESIEEVFLQENRCLRAPGSPCFSSMDCASNSYIAGKLASLDDKDSTLFNILNPYEIRFWKEELVCAQAARPEEEDFDLKKNRCCRETEKSLSIGHATVSLGGNFDVHTGAIPGLMGVPLNNRRRYHRISTVWDLMNNHPNSYPILQGAPVDSCPLPGSTCQRGSLLQNQFNTFSAIGDRTCCSGHWVREFNREENGGGHHWEPAKLQSIPKDSLRCLNWTPCNAGEGTCGGTPENGYFSCEHTQDPDDPLCLMRATPLVQAVTYFDFLATLELAGVPGVKIKSKDWEELHCRVDPKDQSLRGSALLPGLVADVDSEPGEYEDDQDSTKRYFSATDSENFNLDNMKMVFEPDEVSCCLPAGQKVAKGTDPKRCCTGFINAQNQRCQLPDYTNVSLYMNRYISSAAKDEPSALFDPDTGYLKSTSDVIRLACTQRVCASGTLSLGVALSPLKYPGHENSDKRVQRFVDGNDEVNDFSGMASLYDEGLRWNTHVYCVPRQLQLDHIVDCLAF